MKKTILLCLAVIWLSTGLGQAAELIPITSVWQTSYESFIPWYAHKKGWDKEEGIDLSMASYRFGREMLADADKWQIGATGALPLVVSPLFKDLQVIGIANDELAANAILVRKDSPILASKGILAAYPEAYGERAVVKGITILCPPDSSAAYLVDRWLAIFDLTRKDVDFKEMSPDAAYQSFLAGEGDALALWAPQTYQAEEAGLKLAATSQMIKSSQPFLLLANKQFAKDHPEAIIGFLRMYLRGIKMMREESIANLTADYKAFYKEWAGKELNDTMVVKDITTHLVFTLDEQLRMLNSETTISTIQGVLNTIAEFQGLKPEDLKDLLNENVTDEFLVQIKEPIKDYR